jgi:hypothetical protein
VSPSSKPTPATHASSTPARLHDASEAADYLDLPVAAGQQSDTTWLSACAYVLLHIIRSNLLQNALGLLGEAMREVNVAVEKMQREHDPLASHISFRAAFTKTSPTPRERQTSPFVRSAQLAAGVRAWVSGDSW